MLEGFDAFMAQALEDWNAPGVGVGVVVGDELVFARGYGYRDYEKKLPFTPDTLCPIASNSKLFTAVAAGMVVETGKLTWDKPVRQSVPAIEFYNDHLNTHVTLRDMLSHRTGITRHDFIWYKSEFTRAELFQRLKYMEPQAPIRSLFLYNNMMYAAAGYLIELQTGRTWEQFVTEQILSPLDMPSTGFSTLDRDRKPDFGVPYCERRDSFELYRVPYYDEMAGVGPAGAIVSSINEMSHWLSALMNEGKYQGKEVLPPGVLKATLAPALALPNTAAEAKDRWELLNATCGMGRFTAIYRGHLLTYHGGNINGFHSQVAFLPKEKMGVIAFVIGDHCAPLANVVAYHVCERLLGMNETPWSSRLVEERLKNKAAGIEKRAKAGDHRKHGTSPSHAIEDYVGEYENAAYGIVKIEMPDGSLQFGMHTLRFPLEHYHYDRFDTPDDEIYGKFAVNFSTNPLGEIDRATISLDEAEVVFTRRPEVQTPEVLAQLAGKYQTPDKSVFEIRYKEGAGLILIQPGAPEMTLTPYQRLRFRDPRFSDVMFEFVMEGDAATGIKVSDPSGELVLPRVAT